MASNVLTHWEPENPVFWHATGQPVAYRNCGFPFPR